MKIHRFARYPLTAAFLLLACQPVLAAADDEEEEQEPWNARWTLAAGTEIDQQSNRGAEVEIGYLLTPTTSVKLDANSSAYSQTLSNGFHSNGVEFGASHDFRHWTLVGAVGTWQASDILTAVEGKLGADLRFKPWTVGILGMYRRSDFESLSVTSAITLADGTVVPVPTTPTVATCKLTNQGFNGHGSYAGDVWGFHAAFTSYQYKNANCSYGDNTGIVEALLHPDKNVFMQLEAPLVSELETIGVRRIGHQNTLLSSELEAGASWKRNDLIVSLGVAHQEEYFSGATSNTLTTTGTADLGHNSGVDVTLGYTRGDTVVSGAFIGFAFRAHF
jgi:hypothetical protein